MAASVTVPSGLVGASHGQHFFADATDAEQMDPCNGLLLAAHLDAAFYQGLMAVAEDARLLLSPSLGHEDRLRLGVTDGLRVDGLTRGYKPFLAYHREWCFRGH
jgi:hypothetical protein